MIDVKRKRHIISKPKARAHTYPERVALDWAATVFKVTQ
jgi:hypothetical protein